MVTIYEPPSAGYADTPLDRDHWVRALESGEAALRELGEAQMHQGVSLPQPDPLDLSPILDHLVALAQVDKGYAWWAAHHYASLGADWKVNPYAVLPEQLTARMQQLKEKK